MQKKHDSLLNLVWPSLVGFFLILIVGILGIEFMLGAKGFNSGENAWAKAQKNASMYLIDFLRTGDVASEQAYKDSMEEIRTLKKVREIIVKSPNETEKMLALLKNTKMLEADARAAVNLQKYVGRSPMFLEAFDLWKDAEDEIFKLEAIHRKIVAFLSKKEQLQDELEDLNAEIIKIDKIAQPMEEIFANKMSNLTHLSAKLMIFAGFLFFIFVSISITLRTRSLLNESKKNAAALANERQKAVITLAAIGDAVITIYKKNEIDYMNNAAIKLCMTSPSDNISLSEDICLVDEDSGEELMSLLSQLQNNHTRTIQSKNSYNLIRKDGSKIPVSWVASSLYAENQMTGAVLVMRDTTREKQLIERLSWLASHDPMTSLLNRHAFEEHLKQTLTKLGENGAKNECVLLFIDVDQFKIVNDTSGHAAGDELLCLISRAISKCIGKDDVFARMGGDEFGVILQNCSMEEGIVRAEQIRDVVSQSELIWGTRRFNSTASIGLVHLDNSDKSLSTALSSADLACYKAKDNGRNRVEVYHDEDVELIERYGEMAWVHKIQLAIEENRLELFSQPIIPLQEEIEPHYELLLRLRDEHGKIVPPSAFIPAAERFGLMPLIDKWVMRNGFANIAKLNEQNEANRKLIYSINLSGATFKEKSLVDEITALFDEYDIDHGQICFEITETHAVTNLKQAIDFITQMREFGCSFALDNFGAGMSSFGYLKNLPIDYLKIDGKLIKGMCVDPIDKAMVEMINHLGHAMKTSTIGEYAETLEIVEALKKSGVDFAQGYALGHPTSWLKFENLDKAKKED